MRISQNKAAITQDVLAGVNLQEIAAKRHLHPEKVKAIALSTLRRIHYGLLQQRRLTPLAGCAADDLHSFLRNPEFWTTHLAAIYATQHDGPSEGR